MPGSVAQALGPAPDGFSSAATRFIKDGMFYIVRDAGARSELVRFLPEKPTALTHVAWLPPNVQRLFTYPEGLFAVTVDSQVSSHAVWKVTLP